MPYLAASFYDQAEGLCKLAMELSPEEAGAMAEFLREATLASVKDIYAPLLKLACFQKLATYNPPSVTGSTVLDALLMPGSVRAALLTGAPMPQQQGGQGQQQGQQQAGTPPVNSQVADPQESKHYTNRKGVDLEIDDEAAQQFADKNMDQIDSVLTKSE